MRYEWDERALKSWDFGCPNFLYKPEAAGTTHSDAAPACAASCLSRRWQSDC